MKTLKNKIAAITIAIFFILSMTASMMLIPSANAHTPPWTIPTYAYINAAPNPAGVGQKVTVDMWLDKVPPTALEQYGMRWSGFTVTVTAPDGINTTLGPFTSDDTGGTTTTYTPQTVGNYTFVLHFPGQTATNTNPSPIVGTQNPQSVGDHYQPSTSCPFYLTVQTQPASTLPSIPLPTAYWSRPIFATNTNWYSISGNWLGFGTASFSATGMYNATGNYNPYTTAPNTAHIMWTQPYASGGLIGGEFGNTEYGSNFMSTSQYEPEFAPIVMNGVLYYTSYAGSSTNPTGWVALDLQTGHVLWTKTTTLVLRCGQLLDVITPNQYGAIAYLWAQPLAAVTRASSGGQELNNTLEMFGAMTGNYILSIVNLPFGIEYVNAMPFYLAEDASGNLLAYFLNSTASTLNLWNSTKAIMQYTLSSGYDTNTWTWRPPQGANIPWNLGIQWSAPMQMNIKLSNGTSVNINTIYSQSAGLTTPLAISAISGTIIVTDMQGPTTAFNQPGYIITEGYSPSTGQLVWGPINQTEPAFSYLQTTGAGEGVLTCGDGVYVIYVKETMSWYGYSTATGKQLWGPVTGKTNSYSFYEGTAIIAYGVLYAADLGGNLNAFNVTTGALLWSWSTGGSGANTPYGIWPFWYMDAVADGKVYITGGHNYSPPMFPGAELYCINATSGKELWEIYKYPITNSATCAISDGYLVEPNAYDNQIYCFGMGPSKTTVTAPDVGVTTATPVTITGTVMDISAGASQPAVAANFPNGLPCVSDASMTQFMEAVYQQQPMPTNITGVPVTLSVTDSNGNHYNIGTTTTNANGFYSLTWTPIITGNYTVTATFAGTQSYYGSSANAAFYAGSPPATPAPTAAPVTGLASTGTVELGVAAVIIVIVICVAVLAVLMLRKRP
jgi:hypothetical protein